jgi:serine phosphatase RsbU (regulator of sigma subunit)
MRQGAGVRRLALSRVTVVAMLTVLVGTAAGVWGIRTLQRSQEDKLLQERTSEVGLILTQSASAIPARLKAHGAVLNATGRSTKAYDQTASSDVTANGGRAAFAWLRPQGSGSFVVLAAQGEGLAVGQVISDERAAIMSRAMSAADLVPSGVIGPRRLLGFALGEPSAPTGTVLYQESTLGPVVNPPRAAATDPFSDLEVALYSTPTAIGREIIVGTSTDLPLTGAVRRQKLPVGTASWLLVVKAKRPLVGDVAATAPWFALVAGLVATGLIGGIVETGARRRKVAESLLVKERETAETFQRSLLPHLPAMPGLDLGARYLASGRGQQVGGDWFDVFPVAGDRVGIVIGDVMGHDLAAASGMAQVRSALRAYALEGECPAAALDLLERFVTTLHVTELVTVLYAVLGPAAADGSRQLSWSNAGHLPPLLRQPDGEVQSLTDGASLLIGTGLSVPHLSGTRTLAAGSTLLLFTDGLVEQPGRSLDEAIDALATAVTSCAGGAEELCDIVLNTAPEASRRDDIAVLAVRLST